MDLVCILCFGVKMDSACQSLLKTISSLVRSVLGTASAHMSPGVLHGTAVLAAYVTCTSLMSSLHAGDRARDAMLARHCFTSLLQIGTRIMYSTLPWTLMSTQPVGKCQTLTYINLPDILGCLAIALPSIEQIVSLVSAQYWH